MNASENLEIETQRSHLHTYQKKRAQSEKIMPAEESRVDQSRDLGVSFLPCWHLSSEIEKSANISQGILLRLRL